MQGSTPPIVSNILVKLLFIFFRMCYVPHDAIIAIYDVTKYHTFENAKYWIALLRQCSIQPQTFIIGNKTDLTEQKVVSTEEALAYAEGEKIQLFELSAVKSKNIEEVR